jgi:hypothetical protein
MILTILRWLERLSLDAVAVAVVWGLALAELTGRRLDAWPVVVLALATWLTYVADRLCDVRPGRPVPVTDRHLYYKTHYKTFAIVWAVVFVAAVLVAVVDLPFWKWAGGWGVVLAVAGYLALLSRNMSPSNRLLLKRLAVPVIFTGGVGWMSECWRTQPGQLALGILLFSALGNVLLISYWESHDNSRPQWLVPAGWISVLGLSALGIVALMLHFHLGLAGLACASGYAILFKLIKPGSEQPVRALVDGVMLLSGAILLIVL